jgi:hypothetical protein
MLVFLAKTDPRYPALILKSSNCVLVLTYNHLPESCKNLSDKKIRNHLIDRVSSYL